MNEKKNYNSDGRSAEDRALDKFAELMIEKLETIQADWKKPWFTKGVSNSLPKNLSGREYNGMNSTMLMLHAEKMGYELPVWCTFDRVVGLNFTKDKQGGKIEAKDSEGKPLPHVGVNKGEKSFPVFITTFTCVNKESKEKIKYDDYKHLTEEERAKFNVFPKLSVYNVFNVGQTNIKEARPELYQKLLDQNSQERPEVIKNGEEFSFPAMDRMIAENKWICPIKPTYGDDAYYSISKAEIVIPEKNQFKSGESFYANLSHEMAHSTGAEKFLNRLSSNYSSTSYGVEELVAEMTAAVTSKRYGMEKCIKDDSLPYLKNWLDSLKENPAFIKSVLQDVKKASSMINQHIDKVQLEIDMEKEQGQVQSQGTDVSYDKKVDNTEAKSFDIPRWAIPMIMYGEKDGLDDNEEKLVNEFLDKNFPDGFIPEIEEGTEKEFNLYPAFGTRNENALPNKGESPYQAVDTVSVKFSPPGYFETRATDEKNDEATDVVVDNTKEQVAAKMPPKSEEEVHYHFGR